MITINPFSQLSESIPSIAMQLFVVVMIILVIVGTLLDIIHKKPIDVFNQGIVIDISGEEVGVTWINTAITADIEIPAFFGGDNTKIFGSSFCAFSGAATDGRLDFVG